MKREIDENDGARHLAPNLVTTWVMGAMLLIAAAFFAQFPETGPSAPMTSTTR